MRKILLILLVGSSLVYSYQASPKLQSQVQEIRTDSLYKDVNTAVSLQWETFIKQIKGYLGLGSGIQAKQTEPGSSSGRWTFDSSGQETSSQSSTSDADVTPKWKQNSATVYIDIADDEANYRQAWQEAIQKWNSYGVFKLTTTSDEEKADIVLKTENESTTGEAGVTKTEYVQSYDGSSAYFTKATGYLNTYYLSQYSWSRVVNTAEHELGHAMGLAHTDDYNSVMYPRGSEHGIEATDVTKLKELYK